MAIAAGGNSDTSTFALALDATGQVYAWGYNDYKQVTKSSENSYALPQKTGITQALDIAAAQGATSYALRSDGAVIA